MYCNIRMEALPSKVYSIALPPERSEFCNHCRTRLEFLSHRTSVLKLANLLKLNPANYSVFVGVPRDGTLFLMRALLALGYKTSVLDSSLALIRFQSEFYFAHR